MRRAIVLAATGSAILSAALAAQDSPVFPVGNATASRGQTAFGELVVPARRDSGLEIPVAVIHGARPGKVVAFVAGSHGTEYASIVAMQRLIPRVDARRLTGTVIVVPLINVPSIEQMTVHTNPIDGRGMNREYPGDSAGTQTQRALFAITRAVIDPADVVVDLHGGDLDEDLRPYSYWVRSGRAAQDSASRTLALAFGLDHIIISDVNIASPTAGRSLSSQSLVRGKTVLVGEAGRSGLVLDADVNALIDGSLNVLGALGMIERRVQPVRNPVWLGGSSRIAAESGGMFFAAVGRDARVKSGDLLGHMTDYHGRKTGEILSPIEGVVTFIRGVPSMWPRATLVNVAPILPSVPVWSAP